jgi:hypothetical protein
VRNCGRMREATGGELCILTSRHTPSLPDAGTRRSRRQTAQSCWRSKPLFGARRSSGSLAQRKQRAHHGAAQPVKKHRAERPRRRQQHRQHRLAEQMVWRQARRCLRPDRGFPSYPGRARHNADLAARSPAQSRAPASAVSRTLPRVMKAAMIEFSSSAISYIVCDLSITGVGQRFLAKPVSLKSSHSSCRAMDCVCLHDCSVWCISGRRSFRLGRDQYENNAAFTAWSSM